MTPVDSAPSRLPGVVRALTALVALAALIFTGACAEPTVAEERTGYEATLNSYAIREVPLEPEPADMGLEMDGEEGAEAEAVDTAAAEDAEGEDGEEMEPVEVRQDLILDIMMERVRRSAELDGVTVDVTHADADEREKAVYKVWIDTSDVHSLPLQKAAVIEDVDYVDGDGFHVEVRHPIPEGERDEYREFSESGDEG